MSVKLDLFRDRCKDIARLYRTRAQHSPQHKLISFQVLNDFNKQRKENELIINSIGNNTEVDVIIVQGNILTKATAAQDCCRFPG